MFVYITGDHKVFKNKKDVEEYVKTPNMSMNIYENHKFLGYYKKVKVR